MGEFDDLIPQTPSGRVGYIPGVPKPDKPNLPTGYRMGSDGVAELIPGIPEKVAAGEGKTTESEKTAAFLATRVAGGIQDLNAALAGDPDAAKPSVLGTTIGMFSEEGRNWANSPARRQVENAQLDILDAALTLGTGAAYTAEQLENYRKSYFPNLTDDAKTIEAKKTRLERLLEAAKVKAGGAAPEIDKALAALGGQAPPERMTAEPRPMAGPSGDNMTLAQGPTHTEDDPALAGVNAKLNEMVKGGASPGQIAGWLQSAGIPPQEVMPSVMQALQFRAKNPNYHGDYNVNVDDRLVPSSMLSQVAASPVGAGAIAAADTLSGGHLDNIVGAGGGNAEMANIGIEASRDAHPTASLVGDIGAGVGLYAGGAGLLGRTGLAAGSGALSPAAMAGDAALGGYVSSGQGGSQIADPGNMAMGAALGAGAGAAGRGLINGAASAISPSGGTLAPLYDAGVRPTLGQRAGGIVNRAEQAFTSLPGVGGIQRGARGAAIDEMQTGAFNEALGEIGLALPKGVKKGIPAHKFMQKAFNDVYDQARSGMQFAPDGEWAKDLGAMQKDANLLSKDSRSIFNKILFDAGAKLRASGGTLDGEQYKIVVSRIGKKIASIRSSPSGDGELGDALESLRGAIDGAARRQSAPESVALLDAADRGYAKAVVIENAARLRGGEPGEFGGVSLDRAVQTTNKSRRSRAYLRGEAAMQPYAAAARHLGENVADSGTTERLLTNGGMAAGAGAVSPYAMIPWAADTLATLPGARQTLGALMAPRQNPAMRGAGDELRRRAYLGSLLAAPAAIEGQ